MSTTNYPSASPQGTPPKKDSKNLIIGLLAVGILGTWGYFLFDKNRSDQKITQLQTQYVAVDSSKNELQKSYDASLSRLDSLTGFNNELEGKLTDRTNEIGKLKGQIGSILKKERLSESEKKKAQSLITELNDKINNLEQEVQRLTAENQQLTTDKNNLTADKEKLTTDLATTSTAKQALEQKVDIASTLNATNIHITPIDDRKGGKEKETTNAKKVDKLVIAFDVNNRIAESGNTDVYICITGPDAKPIAVEAQGSGKFTTREDGEKLYTLKVPVQIETGKSKHVEMPWKQGTKFAIGSYKIEIYQNGYKIGEGTQELKKGGLFG